MLVVTTSVRMVDWIHSHTTDNWKSLSKSLEFMEKNPCLHNWLFVPAPSCNYSDSGPAASRDSFSGARR